ncbi:unnamed protein product [Mycena citricolor]|uniref:N-terminal nucleophile aminohydrolase n=1 Tax=Mycena citricolor TaxID=2018698 RepID=A0AAD2K7H4_9AGAR|nr:unnamed protein product [Mycena citricolor]
MGPEVKNPISLARQILDHSRVPDPLYRIPPLTLVSHGAHAFARTANLNLVEPQHLITDKARKQWARWKTRLNNPLDVPRTEDEDSVFQDTVGAVVWDTEANEFAAGVSSGGILLKHAGRAAVYGAGCWAQNCSVSGERSGMACRSGEYIIRANLARSICHAVDADIQKDGDIHETLRKVLVEEFWLPSRSPSNPDPSAGIVLLVAEADDDGLCTDTSTRLVCIHDCEYGCRLFFVRQVREGRLRSSVSSAAIHSSLPQAVIFRRPMTHASKAGGPHVFITGFAM